MKEIIHGQGHGVAGRFAGLEDPYGLEKNANIVLLPVPFDKTSTYQKGSNFGPEALIEASRHLELYDIETDSQVYLAGIFTAAPVTENESKDMLEETYRRTKGYLAQGKFVVVIGGEHSISYAPIRAHADHYPKISVLQLDAHADLQMTYEGDPWSHACIMARVRELPNVTKSIAVGIRSMAIEEKILYEPANTFLSHTIDQNDDWMDQVLAKLSDHVYITFDLDAFDSSLMPSTGTPEPGGLQWNQSLKLLRRVSQEKTIIGFDIVELCPSPSNKAPDYLAAKLIYKLLSYVFTYSNQRGLP